MLTSTQLARLWMWTYSPFWMWTAKSWFWNSTSETNHYTHIHQPYWRLQTMLRCATERKVYPPATGSLTEETCSSSRNTGIEQRIISIFLEYDFSKKKWHPIIITIHQRVAKLHFSRFSQISRWTEKKTWTTRGHHGFLGHVPMAFHGFPWPCWMVKFRLDGLFIPQTRSLFHGLAEVQSLVMVFGGKTCGNSSVSQSSSPGMHKMGWFLMEKCAEENVVLTVLTCSYMFLHTKRELVSKLDICWFFVGTLW